MSLTCLARLSRGQASITDGRTVPWSEIGLIYAFPNGFSWRDVGALVSVPNSDYFHKMAPDSLKIAQGRFQHFQPADDTHYAFFPYSELKNYEAQEVRNGRAPLFVTATYQGARRPVYFAWSLKLRGDVPTAPREEWMQAVNVGSDRFIQFWVNEYVDKILWRQSPTSSVRWVGLDNCAFMWNLYGVVNDRGHFVSGVRWDRPFPRTSDQFVTAIEHFFHQLAEIAPYIRTMCNMGALDNWSQFKTIYAEVPGLMAEDIAEANSKEYARTGKYDILTALSWFVLQSRIVILRAIVPPNDLHSLRTAYMLYSLVRGQNTFFAPELNISQAAVPPSEYSAMRAALGQPVGPMQVIRDRTKGSPYNLYSRQCQHGIVYVNWTGTSQVIALPSSSYYFNPEGSRVSVVVLPDLTGTYVTTVEAQVAH